MTDEEWEALSPEEKSEWVVENFVRRCFEQLGSDYILAKLGEPDDVG